MDSNGDTVDFMLSPTRSQIAAKRFFKKALKSPHNNVPRVISVDKNIAYPPAIEKLKENENLPEKVKLRQVKYLNNIGVCVATEQKAVLRLLNFTIYNQAYRYNHSITHIGNII